MRLMAYPDGETYSIRLVNDDESLGAVIGEGFETLALADQVGQKAYPGLDVEHVLRGIL